MRNLLARLFGRTVAGAVHTGATPVMFTDIYQSQDGWSFSFHDAKHEDGGIWGPYSTKDEAILMRDHFVDSRKGKCSFVHQGVQYRKQGYYSSHSKMAVV